MAKEEKKEEGKSEKLYQGKNVECVCVFLREFIVTTLKGSISFCVASFFFTPRRPSTHKNMCINLFLSPIFLNKIYYYYIFFSLSPFSNFSSFFSPCYISFLSCQYILFFSTLLRIFLQFHIATLFFEKKQNLSLSCFLLKI